MDKSRGSRFPRHEKRNWKIKEGYELVRAEEVENAGDYPVLEDGKHKGVIGVGGLLLTKVPLRSLNKDNNTWPIVIKIERTL